MTRSLLGLSRFAVAAMASSLIVSAGVRGQSAADQTGSRISNYVSTITRAQSIVTDEAVTVQPINRDWSFDGFARRLVYELRVEWNPSVEGDESPATVTRRLLTVNGRPPRKGDKPECMDPRSVSPEPLAFLLPDGGRSSFTERRPRTRRRPRRADGGLPIAARGQADSRVDRRVRER